MIMQLKCHSYAFPGVVNQNIQNLFLFSFLYLKMKPITFAFGFLWGVQLLHFDEHRPYGLCVTFNPSDVKLVPRSIFILCH